MSQNINKNRLVTKRKGPVWKAKVGIYSPLVVEGQVRMETRLWKIKEILN